MAPINKSDNALSENRLDWLARDHQFNRGLDHLGIQIVSTSLYDLMLPGITNVTDRIRYHSFYSWVLDQYAHDERHGRREWREWLRSHEFAFALASQAFQVSSGFNERAVVGTETARRVLQEHHDSAGTVHFRALVDLDTKERVPPKAYFKNPQGGFGQYYKGTADSLGLIVKTTQHTNPDCQLTNYAGVPLARSCEAAFEGLRDIARSRSASVPSLGEVGRFSTLSSIQEGSEEENILRQVLLQGNGPLTKGQNPHARHRRQTSLGLILHYLLSVKHMEDGGALDDFVAEFRWACASSRLPDGSMWQVPNSLSPMLTAWKSYHRNDIMNFTLEAIHWVCLRRLEDARVTPIQLAKDVASTACDGFPGAKGIPPVPPHRSSVESWISECTRLPAHESRSPWGPESTFQWFANLRESVSEENDLAAASWALLLLGRVAAELRVNRTHPFSTLPGAIEIAQGRPIHLHALTTRTSERSSAPIQEFLSDLILEWVLLRHLRVATLKLAAQHVFTFRFRPEADRLILLDEPPVPTLTNPRLRQATQFLEDLHYVGRTSTRLAITSSGENALRELI